MAVSLLADVPRWKFSDLRVNTEFEITITNAFKPRMTYYNKFYVLNAEFDVGIDKPDIRKCELCMPVDVFRNPLITLRNHCGNKFKATFMKLPEGKLKVIAFGKYRFVDGKLIVVKK